MEQCRYKGRLDVGVRTWCCARNSGPLRMKDMFTVN
jgi:hypothetical protein